MSSHNVAVRVLKGIARWTDRLRRVLHLIFLLVILFIVITLISPPLPVVPRSAALVLTPSGVIVDELQGDPFQRALALAQGITVGETRLSDLIEAVRLAADDERIKALVLDLDGMLGAGLSKLQELALEIDRFKASGKPVFAIGSSFERDQYYLAAHADEVFMHPLGLVMIDGYSSYIPYYKSALEKLYVDYNTWTVGEYKSLFEPETRDDMSPADREARGSYLDALWGIYQADVEAARGLDPGSLQRYADSFGTLVESAGGDAAALAVAAGFVDASLPFDEMRARIRAVVNAPGPGEAADSYASIDHRNYLTAVHAPDYAHAEGDKVALLVAAGTILDGLQPPGSVGADSMIERIRAARDDDSVRAMVLRIDSPGGSAFASDLILRELELFQASGKPIVVSMGSVAASGGYWISMGADEIVASPATLTGSIGVGAALPAFDRSLAALGIHVDGLGTTALSGQSDPLQGIGDDIGRYVQSSIEYTYEQFVTQIALHRNRDPADIYAAAEGRVWIGGDALERGLVDRLGNLEDAIGAAADLAGLADGRYSVERLEPNLGLAARLALGVVRAAAPVTSKLGFEPAIPAAFQTLIDAAAEPLSFVDSMNDPRGIYSYCFCDVD
jgi:protease-4